VAAGGGDRVSIGGRVRNSRGFSGFNALGRWALPRPVSQGTATPTLTNTTLSNTTLTNTTFTNTQQESPAVLAGNGEKVGWV